MQKTRERNALSSGTTKLKLLGTNWSFYTGKSYMLKRPTYHWLQQYCFRITIGLITMLLSIGKRQFVVTFLKYWDNIGQFLTKWNTTCFN